MSFVQTKKHAIVFIALAVVCAFYTAEIAEIWMKVVAASASVAFAGVGLAYAFLGPRLFMKRTDGSLSPISYLVFWPYYLISWFNLLGYRLIGRERPFDKIEENVYLGGRLNRYDEAAFARLNVLSVLDLTCEFSELPALRRLAYRCIPILDAREPTLDEAQSGAHWIKEQSKHGPVYVHCALGHGRSATFVAAYLLLSGKVQTAEEAVAKMQSVRPLVKLSDHQWGLLRRLATGDAEGSHLAV